MTQRQGTKLLRKWQDRFRLQNWEISLALNGGDLNEDGRLAEVSSHPCHMRAAITIAGGQDDSEVECSILHELLHIVLSEMREEMAEEKQFIREGPWNLREEQAVFRIEECIMGLEGANNNAHRA